MAWRCTGVSNADLVTRLAAAKIISTPRVRQAMESVDRAHYSAIRPYEDAPQLIGHGATISAPHMHGFALEHLYEYLRPGMKALDVGSGSGYLVSCMARLLGDSGLVVGIDHIQELVDQSHRNIESDDPSLLSSGRVKLVCGDGRLGYPDDAPYDCIHVGAAAEDTPEELIAQLKSPGRMFVPVGQGFQKIMLYDKDQEGKLIIKELMDVMYVPLTDAEKQKSKREKSFFWER